MTTTEAPEREPDPGTPDGVPVQVAMQRAMRAVRGVAKNDRNRDQGFNFRGIDAVLNAVGPALREHGVIPLPRVLEHHAEQYESKRGARMRNVTLMVEYAFVGPNGDRLVVEVPGEAADSGDKAYSKAMSVAFRTALIQALALPTDEDDPDSQVHERAPHATPPQQRRPEPEGRETEETAADRRRKAAHMLVQVLSASSRESALNLWKLTKNSAYADVDVSGLLDADDREALGVEKGAPVTIQLAAAKAGKYVAEHGTPVRVTQDLAADQEPADEPAGAE